MAKRDFSPCVILTIRKFCDSSNQGKCYLQVFVLCSVLWQKVLLYTTESGNKSFGCANAVLKTIGKIAV